MMFRGKRGKDVTSPSNMAGRVPTIVEKPENNGEFGGIGISAALQLHAEAEKLQEFATAQQSIAMDLQRLIADQHALLIQYATMRTRDIERAGRPLLSTLLQANQLALRLEEMILEYSGLVVSAAESALESVAPVEGDSATIARAPNREPA